MICKDGKSVMSYVSGLHSCFDNPTNVEVVKRFVEFEESRGETRFDVTDAGHYFHIWSEKSYRSVPIFKKQIEIKAARM